MAKLEAISLPDVPQIQLYLINADFPTGPLPADVMHAVIKNPAYWAFCWGSGLALAQWLLDNPNSVEGKVVADVGCGSGVVAIAAKIAGAKQVIACDNDPDALLATQANAELNNVSLDYQSDLLALPYVEQILMADVLYDRANFALIRLAKQKTQAIYLTVLLR